MVEIKWKTNRWQRTNLVDEQAVQCSGVFIENIDDATQWRRVISQHVVA